MCPSRTQTRLSALSLHGAGCKPASCGEQTACGLWLEVLSFLQQVSHLEMCQAGPGQHRSSAEHSQLKPMAIRPSLSPGVSLLPHSWEVGCWCRKDPTMQILYGKNPTMQIYPCWQPGAEGQTSGAGFAELVAYCCPTSRKEGLLLVASNHEENMVPSEAGLCWQGERKSGLLQ